MSEIEWQADNCLSMLGELEDSWQAAVDRAMSVRDEQLTRAQQAISSLQIQLKKQESLLVLKEQEIGLLKLSLSDLNMKLDSAQSDIANLLEEKQRQLEEKTKKHKEELEMTRNEVDELRTRHKESIRELTAGARATLEDLETQLETVKTNESMYKKQVDELEKVNSKNEKHLSDWNRVSEQMCAELSEIKTRLHNSKYSNSKLREEMALWKKYCEKVEEERKTLKREIELERKVMKTLSQVDNFLKCDRQQRNMILDAMNNFGRKIMDEFGQKNMSKKPALKLVSVESQTEIAKNDIDEKLEKENEILVFRQKEIQLEEELKKAELDVDNLTQQNITLREVIKAMKREREHWEKEKEQIEEEVRVSKLEESVRFLKNNLMHEQKDVCVWSALQDVKKEVSNLKNKNLYKNTKSN
ncbi:centrosomal protein of 55 kDa-like [Homalodisca vitripennis]|uniref:centrosomal protein of 55 kDa-like n=1 Tax=Homalodisca vitripennis TaxID=197043 RepID=UPI001EEAD6DC|nr:centrosomal protein of 55 kDa-like [Homalodisca vitripennis]